MRSVEIFNTLSLIPRSAKTEASTPVPGKNRKRIKIKMRITIKKKMMSMIKSRTSVASCRWVCLPATPTASIHPSVSLIDSYLPLVLVPRQIGRPLPAAHRLSIRQRGRVALDLRNVLELKDQPAEGLRDDTPHAARWH